MIIFVFILGTVIFYYGARNIHTLFFNAMDRMKDESNIVEVEADYVDKTYIKSEVVTYYVKHTKSVDQKDFYKYTYSYVVDGKEYTYICTTYKEMGEKETIIYLKSDPSICHDDTYGNIGMLLIKCFGIFMGSIIIIYGYYLSRYE